MPFVVPPLAFSSSVWLCWHASLFLVDCIVAFLSRSLSLFLSFWCCAPHRVPLVLWWALCQAEVSVAWAAHLGVSPWHADALVEGQQRARPGEAPLRRRVLLPLGELGSAGVDPGPRESRLCAWVSSGAWIPSRVLVPCFACGGIGQRAAYSAELLTQCRLGRLGWEDRVPSVSLAGGRT